MPKKFITLLLLFLLGSGVYSQKVDVTKSGEKYHKTECKYLSKSKIEINLKEAGIHEVEFNGKNLSNGICFYRIQAGNFIDSKKMLLLK